MKEILAKLIYNLIKSGYINEAEEIDDILNNLNEEEKNMLANSNGLVGDVKPQQPIGGLSVEPFFAEKSTL